MLTFVNDQRMGVLSLCDSFQFDVAVLQNWLIVVLCRHQVVKYMQ